ncbi:hypothetical protein BC834DRAFT_815887 [Gloeopeniophorella convolvens]|nr:hypothetical protein BC834DRAFT_815887 [Gloeopeniophorella convolvens]
MRRFRPLAETHPEFLVIETPGLCREYRVENRRTSHEQHGLLGNLSFFSWLDAFFALLIGFLWRAVLFKAGACLGFFLIIYWKVTEVLWESVIVLPPYGIQFETQRGLSPWPLFVSRTFVPLNEVRDILINEGLRRWDVRYYLAVLSCSQLGHQRLDVAYENILPRFPVLIRVYQSIHEYLQTRVENVQEIIDM